MFSGFWLITTCGRHLILLSLFEKLLWEELLALFDGFEIFKFSLQFDNSCVVKLLTTSRVLKRFCNTRLLPVFWLPNLLLALKLCFWLDWLKMFSLWGNTSFTSLFPEEMFSESNLIISVLDLFSSRSCCSSFLVLWSHFADCLLSYWDFLTFSNCSFTYLLRERTSSKND